MSKLSLFLQIGSLIHNFCWEKKEIKHQLIENCHKWKMQYSCTIQWKVLFQRYKVIYNNRIPTCDATKKTWHEINVAWYHKCYTILSKYKISTVSPSFCPLDGKCLKIIIFLTIFIFIRVFCEMVSVIVLLKIDEQIPP